MACLPGSSIVSDLARPVMKRSRSGLIMRPCPTQAEFRRLPQTEHGAPWVDTGESRWTASRLSFKERAEHCGPSTLEIAVLLETAPYQNLDSPLGLSPSQCDLEGVESVEKLVGGWQRDLVDKSLCRRDCTSVEGGDPSRERIDKAVQFRFWKRTVDISVSLCGIAIEIVRAKNDFERAATANQMWETFRAAAAGVQSYPDLGLA
jgi:hypothetical protein